MKFKILYIVIFLCFTACKTDKQQNSDVITSEQNTSKLSDTAKKATLSKSNQEQTKSLKDKLIGKIYSDVKDIKEFKDYNTGGATIGDDFNGKTYTFSSFRGTNDIVKYIILEQSLGSESNKKFQILDILDLTKENMLSDDDKNLYYHFCYKDGKNDQEIIAIAEYEEKEFLTKIIKAWRADRKTEKIIEIPVDGIKIENMDYGL